MRIAPFALLMTLLAASACEKERDAVSSENDSGVSLAISIDSGQTRSILEDEGVDSGFYMMIYNSDSGEFVDCISFESRSGGELILRKGEVYDMYVLGNMWYVDADGGRRTLKDIGVTSVSDYVYRFDGGVDAGGTRRENFSEIVRYGIPYSGMVKRVKAEEGATVNVSCTYLFAKLSVTVDHSGLVNGSVAESVFRNSKLYVRGANSVVKPFASSSVKAESASDILAVSDYSLTMENGGSLTFTYYVPENAQGDASVSDPLQKTTAMKPLATYIEFETVVDGAAGTAGGYGGTVTYQFCPGANATTDFNVLRNTQYNVTLSFKAGSLFSPSWKVGVDDWSDTRTIRFSADNAGSSESLLKDDGTQVLAVRKNRPAQCYVYFNRSGAAGSNERDTYLDYLTTAQVSTYNPSNVSRSGYSLVYDSSVLSQYGMSLSYDSTTGKITVSYNPASAGAANFLNVPAAGIPVTVTLYPGSGAGKTVTALVKTYENMAVSVTSGDRYVGMKTNVKVSGFVGSDVKVSANNGSVTPGVFRTSNSPTPGGSGAEGTDNYLGSTPVAVPAAAGGGFALDLYAYRNAASLTLNFSSEDSFNDGVHSTTLTVYKPSLSLDKTSYLIPIDGTEVDVEYSYRDRSGDVMQPSVFDSAVYSQLMDPQLSLSDPVPAQTSGAGAYAKATDCCSLIKDDGSGAGSVHQVYAWDLPRTNNTMNPQPITNTPLGYVNVRGRNATLFPARSAYLEFRYPSLKTGFSDIKSNVFNEAADPVVEVTATIDAAGCGDPLEVESGAGTPSQTVRGYTVVSGNDYGAVHPHKDDGWNYVCLFFDAPDAGGNRVLHWRWKPNVSNPYNFGDGIYAPWGERKVQVTYCNNRPNPLDPEAIEIEKFYTTSPTTFDVSYQEVRILSFCSYPLGQQVGRVDLSCKLSAYLASKWHSEGSTSTVWGTRLFNSINYSAQARQRNMNDWDSPQGGALIINSSSLDARYISWSLEHMDWDPESTPWDSHYQDAVWDEDNIDEQQRRRDGLPTQMGFNGTSVTLLPDRDYPGSTEAERTSIKNHIPIRTTTDVYIYTYNAD